MLHRVTLVGMSLMVALAGAIAAQPVEGEDPIFEETFDRPPIEGRVAVLPSIFLGQSKDYLSAGFAVVLRVGMDLEVGNVVLRPSFRSGVDYFRAEGEVRSSRNLLWPLGVDVSVIFSRLDPVTPWVSVHGGTAVFLLQTDENEWLSKSVPFVGIGTGAKYQLTHRTSIAATVETQTLFESTLLIIQLRPGIEVQVSI